MSDTLRNYGRRKATKRVYAQNGPRRRQRQIAQLLLGACFLIIFVWGWRASRDLHDEGEFVPSGQSYQLVIGDLLAERHAIAASPVWRLVSDSPSFRGIPEYLTSNYGMPPWVLRNIISGPCHISGTDLTGLSDPLFVTRMSRIGCLLERFHWFTDMVELDPAGGLQLRYLPKASLYYAVRGRVLVLTPSRERLIHALTLVEGGSIGDTAYRAAVENVARPQLHLTPKGEDGTASYVSEALLGFGFREDALQIHATWSPGPSLRPLVRSLFSAEGTRELHIPDGGHIRLAGDLRATPGMIWNALLEGMDGEFEADAWTDLTAPFLADPGLAGLLQDWWHADGQPFWLALQGVDQEAMVPTPQILGGTASLEAPVKALVELAPIAPADGSALPYSLFADPERRYVYLPLLGGPALEPAIAVLDGEVAFGTSSPLLKAYLEQERPSTPRRKVSGSFYVEMYPEDCVRDVRETGLSLASFGALRGFTAETFAEWLAPWESRAQQIPFAGAAIRPLADGKLDLQLDLRFSGQSG